MTLFARLAGLLLLALPFAGTPVQAAPVVNTYQVVSRFSTGPFAQITSLFTLSFDPAISSGAATVTGYSSSNANAAFNPAVVQFSNEFLPGQASSIFVGGSNAGPSGIVAGTADFSINFFADPTTGAVPAGRMLVPYNVAMNYSLLGGTTVFTTFDNTISIVTAAVPEPAAWAMMMLGIGLAGAMLRRGRRQAAAFATI